MENIINVAMFSDSFYPIIGGRENVIHNLMSSLVKSNKCFLLTSTFKGHHSFIEDKNLPYEVIRCKSLRITKNEYLSILDRKTKKLIKSKIENGEINIIHTQTKYALAKFALKLGKKYNIPIVTTAHTNYIQQYKNQLKFPFIYKPFLKHVKHIINKMDSCFTVSNHMKNLLIDLGVKTKIKVIPNGNDMINYQPTKLETEKVLNEYNLKNTSNIFIYVGRVVKTKNLDFLLHALKIIKDEKKIDFKLLIVGGGELDKYKSLAEDLSLLNHVIFTGPISDRNKIATLYKISNLNLYPSTGESFGLTIREAGALKTPSVTIENCATSEDIINNVNGFISKLDVNSYANTIIDAVQDKSRLLRIGDSAKTSFSLSWDDVADIHLKEYSETKNNID